jgi:fatty acid desaturase
MRASGVAHFVGHLIRSFLWGAVLLSAVVWAGPRFADGVAAVMTTGGGAWDAWWSLALSGAVVAIPAALVFFSAFALFHDAAHGALALPQRINDAVLLMTSLPLLMSAHGQRQHHLHHHAHPLEPTDLEGQGALTSLWWAALVAPWASVKMRVAGFNVVPAKVRPWVVAENLLNVASIVVVALLDHPGVWVSFFVQLTLQHTMNAWASHVPHRAPRWLMQLASRGAWTGSPVILSLVYHLEHHATPRVPCALLRPASDVESPLLARAIAEPLPWPPLQLDDRPRPRR